MNRPNSGLPVVSRCALARIALCRWRKKRLFEKKMLKILRAVDGSSVVFVLSGRIEAEHLAELRRLLDAEEHDVALDLNEVTLVDRDTIRFLAGCEADGVRLRNCPSYICNWLQKEKGCQ